MTTTTEKKLSTREKMLEAARDLFHRNGVRATSVDQVLEASGTGKSQFYHYFKSKEGLVRAVVAFYCNLFKEGGGPNQITLESLDDLEKWFRFHVEMQRSFNFERCCPLGTIANDLESDQEEIRKDLDDVLNLIRKQLTDLFVRLKENNKMKEEADPRMLAEFCLTTIQGGFLVSKVKRDSFPVENAVAHAMNYLRTYAV